MKFNRISWALPAIVYLFCAFTVNAGPSTSVISGVVATSNGVGVEGVNVIGDNGAGSGVTAADGAYSIVVPNNWNGTMSVSKTGWLITPAAKTYSNVRVDIPNENYMAFQPTISGYVRKADGTPLEGVTITADNGGGNTVTNLDGYYSIAVPCNWSGTVTANKMKWQMTSASYSYSNLNDNKVEQNFTATYSGIIIVKPDGTGNYPTIQAAIDAAATDDIIILEAGTYIGTGNHDIDFAGKAVAVQGNLSDPNQVVINCQGTFAAPHRGFKFMTAETEDSILAGVTISQGYAPFDIAAQPNMGGAVYCAGSSPTLRHCIFRNNTACFGGGVYTKNSSAIILGCQFLNNSSESSCSGGGMYNESSSPHIEDCLFSANYGYHYAGGMFNSNSSPAVINCRFLNNVAESFGGGMANYESSNPQIANCLFSGNRIGQSGYGSADAGAAMYNMIFSSPGIADCSFINNSTNSHQNGGAMGNCYYSSPSMTRCTFSGNSCGINGGAIYNKQYASPVITECTFASNTALAGGGIYNIDHSSPLLTKCTFSGNSATGQLVSPTPQGGGAVYSGQQSNPRIRECEMMDNDAYYGGGMFNWDASPEIIHSSLIGNYAYSGGGIYNKASSSPVLDTCYLESNEAKSKGGAVFNDSASPVCVNTVLWKNIAIYYGNSYGGAFYNTNASPSLLHCTLVSNSSMGGSGFYNTASSPVITNCILWDGDSELSNNSNSVPVITYSAMNTFYSGTGNVYYENPLFVNITGGDFRITRDSPCVDTANNAAVPAGLTADKLGTPRIIDGDGDGTAAADMGAYEYYLPGDVTMNAAVNGDDLMQFFPQWLRIDCLMPENCMQADIDRNGKVNLTDFGLLASHWLEQ